MKDATLTSLSKIEVGQTILVTDVPGLRGFARPKDPDALALRVTAKAHVPDEWTGKVWTLTLSDGTETTGRYGTTHVYVTKDKQKTARKIVVEDEKVSVVEVPVEEDGTELVVDLAVSGAKRVRVAKDGTMTVQDWTGGEVTERTPKGRLVHIAADGVLTILEDFPEEDESPTARIVKAEQAWHDHVRTMNEPTHRPATDDEAATADRCHTCKGYGVVRKTGSKAGKPYRTLAGAEESTVKGNSEQCPTCKGATLLVRSA